MKASILLLLRTIGMALAIFCLLGPKISVHTHEQHESSEHTPHSSDEEDCAQCQFYFASFFLPENSALVTPLAEKSTLYCGFDAQLSNTTLSFYTGLAPPVQA